ncbi:MAG: ribosome biogenesis GTPase YlqF [Clostridia bacterium]|nr:ribosome biogenesis GTPase YlqF [Clostridia bacterium]
MNINWYPGHMAKTKRQIIEDLKLIDVVVEILDARIPMSSQNPDVKGYTKNKKKVVVLNKTDLADEVETKKWVKYFESKGIPAVVTDSNSGKGINEVIRAVKEVSKENQEKFADKGRVGKSIRIMILGIPNVGKSSFINRITKKNSAQVGNRPGVTRQKQWIRIEDGIELMDTPGVLWPKFESEEVGLHLAFTGSIKDDILEKTEITYQLLRFLVNNYLSNVIERYKLDENSVNEILISDEEENMKIVTIMEDIAKKRGAILSGGRIDYEKVSGILLDEFRSGKIGRITIEKK